MTTLVDNQVASKTSRSVLSIHALRPLARLAAGRTGADIERIIREARRAARREGRSLEWQDIADLLQANQSARSEQARWQMAVHEAGHALVHLVIGNGQITLISIETHGGGMVQIVPQSDELETEARMLAAISVWLAGRAAEELTFGKPTAGSAGSAQSDLATATDIATMLETTMGFGSHQPLLYRSVDDRGHMLALDSRLATRVNARLEECYDHAKTILGRERDTHQWLARTILDHGVLEGKELEVLLDQARQRIRQSDTRTEGRLMPKGPSFRNVDKAD